MSICMVGIPGVDSPSNVDRSAVALLRAVHARTSVPRDGCCGAAVLPSRTMRWVRPRTGSDVRARLNPRILDAGHVGPLLAASRAPAVPHDECRERALGRRKRRTLPACRSGLRAGYDRGTHAGRCRDCWKSHGCTALQSHHDGANQRKARPHHACPAPTHDRPPCRRRSLRDHGLAPGPDGRAIKKLPPRWASGRELDVYGDRVLQIRSAVPGWRAARPERPSSCERPASSWRPSSLQASW